MIRLFRYSVLILAFIMASASTTLASLIPVQIDLTINYFPQDPIQPPDPMNVVTVFGQNVLVSDQGDFLFSPFLFSSVIPTIAGNTTSSDTFTPTDPCDTERDLFFTLSGTAGAFDAFAFPTGTLTPTPPPIVPLIDLGSFATAGGSMLSSSGPIFAFPTAVPTGPISPLNNIGVGVQVGTWGVTVTAIPEPSTLVLLGMGLAGVGIVRRRFKR